jgi:FAD-dependent urate hydroxylase
MSLERLAQQVKRELALLDYPARDWIEARSTRAGEPVLDVLVVGGGQGGLACAFALSRERVRRVLVVDEHPLDHAGPWLGFARMRTLRTPKYLTGPDLGVPSLTPRAYCEALFGEDAYPTLGQIPREVWADYLRWYREVLGLPVQPDTRVTAVAWDEAERAFRVTMDERGRMHTRWARRVVLATGIEGSGAWHVPDEIRAALPRERYAHTSEAIDFAALRGKRVAVLGAGASAFDNAACALEAGAAEASVLFRRPELTAVNPYRWAEFVGFLKHFGDLGDADKWRFVSQLVRMGQLPPAETVRRAQALAGFRLVPGCARCVVERTASGLSVDTSHGRFEADFLIVGTGFVTDLSLRPELAAIAPLVARWGDRYLAPDAAAFPDLVRHPYLGPSFEFTEREPGSAPWLAHLYNYTFGCLLSLGFGGASISGMKYSLGRLVSGITRSFFLEQREQHYASLCAYDEREF